MIRLRVTKYDPPYRKPDGTFAGAEWTSCSDIGRTFDGNVLTKEQYLITEDAYVTAAREFLSSVKVDTLEVCDYENTDTSDLNYDVGPNGLYEGQWVSDVDLDEVIRAALRETIWCRLEGEDRTHIHFGYDYYMYFGSDRDGAYVEPRPLGGIYYEVCDSPYLKTH